MPTDVTMDRLDDQIGWYDRKSGYNQIRFKALKVTVIVAAALIPVLSSLSSLHLRFLPAEALTLVLGALGALIAIIEGIQQLSQYHANWISYRSTCEALRHEKYLYLAQAGPYAAAPNPHVLLAERIESLISQEHAKWASAQATPEKPAPQAGQQTGPQAGGEKS